MTDLKHRLDQLLAHEPEVIDIDVERAVTAGRRSLRHRRVALAGGSALSVAVVVAAIVVPVELLHDDGPSGPVAQVASQPTLNAAKHATKPQCSLIRDRHTKAGRRAEKTTIAQLVRKRAASSPGLSSRVIITRGQRWVEICVGGRPKSANDEAPEPTGPAYHYTADPHDISSRLGDHLVARLHAAGLEVTRPEAFSQESSTVENGRPDYFNGYDDVRVADGFGNVGVQVIHKTTEQQPFTGTCNAAPPADCRRGTLADGSLFETHRDRVTDKEYILVASVHRSDGVEVTAQESNYAFGPDATGAKPGEQPLTLDQLLSLVKDDHFTF